MSSIYPEKAPVDSAVKLIMARKANELKRLQALMVLPVEGLLLDLTKIPTRPPGIKDALIKWIIKANEDRIAHGDKVLVTKELILACPLWKVIPIPFANLELTPEALFNGSLNQTPKGNIGKPQKGAINRSRKR